MTRQPFLHDLAVMLRAPVVCLSGADGQVREVGGQGVLAGDVRVLSRAVVAVGAEEPEPIGHGAASASASYHLGVVRGGEGHDPAVWLRRDRDVLVDGLREMFTLVNRSDEPLETVLTLELAADFTPIGEIKHGGRDAPVVPRGLRWNAGGVVVTAAAPGADVGSAAPSGATAGLTSRGAADGTVAEPGGGGPVDGDHAADPAGGDAVVLRWVISVPPRSSVSRAWSLTVQDGGAVVGAPPHGLDRGLVVEADDRRLPRLLDRSLDDLDALLLAEPGRADVFAGAGSPWYLTLFGRDSLWTARMLLAVDPRVAAGTLRTLARRQGTRSDPETGEEPGKILHEVRRCSLRKLRSGRPEQVGLPPLYYGTIDATPLWVILLHDAWRWGLPAAEVEALLPACKAALDWMARSVERDGFAAYLDESGHGLVNQGWKDSADAVRFADGRIAVGPVALAEVQGYLHEAAVGAADLLAAFGRPGSATWRDWATELAGRFRERFWAGGLPAMALDGDGKPVDAVTSNIGHLLGTGLLDAGESERVGARLAGPDLASGFGLRTMSSAAGGYSPLSYHCGSVWPHDTAIVMRGLARAGQAARAAALGRALLVAADGFDRRLPELFAGFGADEVAAPVPYPASCRPQAWSAAAAVMILEAALGLTVDVPRGVITLRPPRPGPFGALSVRGLRVGGGRLDVDLAADGRVTHVSPPPGLRVNLP